MEIRCGSCNKLFRVSDDKITGKGIKFACTSCGDYVKITRADFEKYLLSQSAASAVDLFEPETKPTYVPVPEAPMFEEPAGALEPPVEQPDFAEAPVSARDFDLTPSSSPDFLQEKEEPFFSEPSFFGEPSPPAEPQPSPEEELSTPSAPEELQPEPKDELSTETQPEFPPDMELSAEPKPEPEPQAVLEPTTEAASELMPEPEQKLEAAPEPTPQPFSFRREPKPEIEEIEAKLEFALEQEIKPEPEIELEQEIEPKPETQPEQAPAETSALAVPPAAPAAQKKEPPRPTVPTPSAAPGVSPPAPRRSAAIFIVIALIVLGLAGFGVFRYMSSSTPPAKEPTPVMVSIEGLQIVNTSGSMEPNGDLLISGTVQNTTDKERTAWYIVATVFDAGGAAITNIKLLNGKQLYTRSDYDILAKRGTNVQELKAKTRQEKGIVIPPKGSVSFEMRYLQPPAGIASFNAALQPFDPARLSREIAEDTK